MLFLRARLAHLALIPLIGGLALSGCGDDGGDAAGEGGAGADEAAYGSECRPVGGDLEERAGQRVDLELVDYAFVPTSLEVDAGVVTFAATNRGEEPHELAFLPGGGPVPFTDDGAPDGEALGEAGAFELEAFPPGEDCTATYDLEPGEYTLFCVVEATDGETHYEKGMGGVLTVR